MSGMTANIVAPPQLAEELTPEREELLRNILNDQQLEHVEAKSAAHYRIRLGIAARDHATVRLKIRGEDFYREIYYSISNEERGSCEMQIKTLWSSTRIEVKHPYVWALCKHRAAEAILAVRNNHKKRTRKLREEKAKREAIQADT